MLIEASIRALIMAAIAASFVAAARRCGKPLTASVEHAVWICVLLGMLSFALPKVTVHAGAPKPAVAVQRTTVPTRPPTSGSRRSALVVAVRTDRSRIVADIWLLGAAFMMLRIAMGLFLTRRAFAGAITIAGEAQIRSAVQEYGGPIARIAESDAATVPMTIGWAEARIVVPRAWRTWSAEQLHAVFAHELAHVRRRDTLTMLLAVLNRAIFWFHPLAWWLERRLAELAEFAADEASLELYQDRHHYARVLVDIASQARPMPLLWRPLSVDFSSRAAARLNRRVNRILDSRVRTGSRRPIWVAAIVIAAAALVQLERPIPAHAAAQARDTRFFLGWLGNADDPSSQISPATAAARERQLVANPDDKAARRDLSVFYYNTGQNERRLELIYWLIEHHPDSRLFSFMSMLILPGHDGEASYMAAVVRWRAAVALFPENPYVLLNAAKAIGESDRNEEVALLKKGQALDRERFTKLLARFYSRVLSFAAERGPATEAESADAVRNDLNSSRDALLLGTTGALLVSDAANAALTARPSYDIGAVRTTAIELLVRAQSLDPENQQWIESMEGARRLLK